MLIVIGAAVQNDRNGGQGDHVVDDRGLAEEALQRRQRRLEAHLAAFALQGFEERGFLAADVGAGAHPHLEVETLAAAPDVLAQVAGRGRRRDRRLEGDLGIGIFPAQVDVAARGAGGHARDGHAFDPNESFRFLNDAVITYGEALLEADRRRLNQTSAIGLDETSFVKLGGHHTSYATTVTDVEHHRIIDILPTRNFVDVAGFLDQQSEAWKSRIDYGALDMSNVYAAVYSVILPKAAQVVDPFHVISLANRALDAVRRRVQTEQTGHRGRRDDPLYRVRRALLTGEEKLDQHAAARLTSLLALGDPDAEVAIAYRVKERLRDFYRTFDATEARAMLDELQEHCRRTSMPPEIQKLGRTIRNWFDKICNFHLARISNGPTEAINNLIKRIKRVGFGFRNFQNYRIRALLYAGKPNWRVLGSIVVR